MQIYVIFGSSGMYDEYAEWMVKAFTTVSAAEDFVSLCQVAADNVRRVYNEYDTSFLRDSTLSDSDWENACAAYDTFLSGLTNEHDPLMPLEYTVSYKYKAVELE